MNRTGIRERPKANIKTANIFSLFKDLRMLILCLVMLMYAGHQSGVVFWMSTYSEKVLNAGAFFSSYIISFFWVGIIAGRVTYSGLSKWFSPRKLLALGSLLGGFLLVWGIMVSTPFILAAAVTLTGALTGATYPILIALGCSWYPENSGAVSSAIFLCSAAAAMFFPWLIGLTGEIFNLKTGMLITGTNLLIIPFLLLSLKDMQERKSVVLEKGQYLEKRR